MKKILLVEDDNHVCSFINKGLIEEGYEVTVAMDGQQGLELAIASTYDLIILDVMLPTMNGIDVCKGIRASKMEVPILFLTALGSTENVVMGLDSGGDDYLAKPFKFMELLARMRTLLRRRQKVSESAQETVYQFSDLTINDDTKVVQRNGVDVSLTSTEYKLLLMFVQNPRRVLSRISIMEQVWGVDFDLGTNVVDVYVNYLRKKIEKHNSDRIIHTVIGMGYVLKEAE
ncbi:MULTISPECIES: response regulator transcription factor [Reichenbachiella]|uniref:DNA-binding response regulator, OmpR family, contains REC and winged-helix (WHTH) domain n=1 Tax=Reichenbachiella agariperforans TaxID=156994 RepID=A0A1M6T3C0_REIAG|nr:MULTISPECIES: response regulator transcription factor [Reichenbachiella]MBU2914828.1 response regulator transcription factor [Reichenbachiella agariperforans]RJE75206.1 DNA-binding response regulator [Reichenbachiella sp. MSK19-1]SHK51513.1 DNA-binding response regulator, OmpR family, contains REC and winged-helix (wHTH) domain [Reichenbachiella agariperforans]